MAGRSWCGTWNNYPDNWENLIKDFLKQDAYAVCGLETAPTTGTKHLQLFIHKDSKLSMRQLKALDESIHWEKCKGTAKENFDYCTKDKNFKEFNIEVKPSMNSTSRRDYQNIPELLKTKTVKELVNEGVINNHSALKFAEEVRKYVMEPYKGPREVYYHWGVSGAGKTYDAIHSHPDIVKCRLESDGKLTNYNGEEVVLLDEVECLSHAQFKELLQLLDVYAHTARVLYGTIPWRAKVIYITSSQPYINIVPPDQNAMQLERRITKIKHYSKNFFSGI